MTTIATLFSGGEGVGAGARMAGINHLWGIEYDNPVAQVARANHFDTITADVLDVDPATLQVPDILHASPVCTNASVANANTKEAKLDIDTAKKTAEFIKTLKPKFFTLENVYPYRLFQAFRVICDALLETGYSFDFWHLNAADYGVPQTRRRLILIGRRDGGQNQIPKPAPTHHDPAKFDGNQMALFAPITKPWVGWYEAIEDLIPFLPDSQFAKWQIERLPKYLIAGGSFFPGAFILDSQNARRQTKIIDDKLNNNSTSLTSRNGENPVFTVTTSHNNNRDVKAYTTKGRVVKMTPRALARFQSFPDWYRLPDNNSLAVNVIGNAVPPLLYSKIVEVLL